MSTFDKTEWEPIAKATGIKRKDYALGIAIAAWCWNMGLAQVQKFYYDLICEYDTEYGENAFLYAQDILVPYNTEVLALIEERKPKKTEKRQIKNILIIKIWERL